MSSLEDNIQNWIINETYGLTQNRLKNLPEISVICRLSEGKNRKIWKFVTKHVKSQQSVAFTRKILQLRQAKNELKVYPETDIKDRNSLEGNVVNAEDKVRFVENNTKSITKDINSLNTLVKSIKEENLILNQKYYFLKLADLNLNKQNDSLNLMIEKLKYLLCKLFANEQTCILKSGGTAVKQLLSLNLSVTSVNKIISQMMLVIENEMFDKNRKCCVGDLNKPVTDIMSNILIIDLVNQLKHLSQHAFKSLNSDSKTITSEKDKLLTESLLQSLKQDHVDSCFQQMKIIKNTFCPSYISFRENTDKSQKDYLSLYIKNESLVGSILYLEEQIKKEQKLTEICKKHNTTLKSQCRDIVIVMDDFNTKLKALYILSNSRSKSYSSIISSLESCKIYINETLLLDIEHFQDKCFKNVASVIDDDTKLSFDLLKSEYFLKNFLKELPFSLSNLPAKLKEFLSLKPFQNQFLLFKMIVLFKNRLLINPPQFSTLTDENSFSEVQQWSDIANNITNLEDLIKDQVLVQKRCGNLEIQMKDWWHQSAQFIPTVDYKGKTLKMWLAVLKHVDV